VPSAEAAAAGGRLRFRTRRAGRLAYQAALQLQEDLVAAHRRNGEDTLVLLEHPPVITLGRGARAEHLLRSPAELAARGVEVVTCSRGGDVTWHGPGQLVGYPIVDLSPRGRDLHRYLRELEEVLIRTLAHFGVAGARIPGKTGVWVGGAKIASIGIAVRRWIAWHGFALNLDPDLSGFAAIVPCGLHGVRMTSVAAELGREVSRPVLEEALISAFASVLQIDYAGEHGNPPPP
jgi:lipoyl(octanoyl) transferase